MKCFSTTVVICLLIANFRLFGNAEKEMQIASITGAILRQLPDAGSKRVTQLPFLETVKIIEEDAKANTVLGVSGNWKKVANKDTEGWVFGPLLKAKNEASYVAVISGRIVVKEVPPESILGKLVTGRNVLLKQSSEHRKDFGSCYTGYLDVRVPGREAIPDERSFLYCDDHLYTIRTWKIENDALKLTLNHYLVGSNKPSDDHCHSEMCIFKIAFRGSQKKVDVNVLVEAIKTNSTGTFESRFEIIK